MMLFPVGVPAPRYAVGVRSIFYILCLLRSLNAVQTKRLAKPQTTSISLSQITILADSVRSKCDESSAKVYHSIAGIIAHSTRHCSRRTLQMEKISDEMLFHHLWERSRRPLSSCECQIGTPCIIYMRRTRTVTVEERYSD
ncbi:hypothetical protein BDR07DRAFT_286531 [Suillus spraguei]|nr:hypothetical protein BDR07DRAFT_286531 [Suillus spraguei]